MVRTILTAASLVLLLAPAPLGSASGAGGVPGLAVFGSAARRGDVVGDLRVLAFESRTFGGSRTLRVWLPPGYDEPRHAATRYATLYLTDGQNLFDPSTNAFGPREWHVDESMSALIASGAIPPTIVVGIDSPAGEGRTREYSPFDDLDTVPPIAGTAGASACGSVRARRAASTASGSAIP